MKPSTDEDTGEAWSPTALPVRDESSPYVARHGQGYNRFQHGSQQYLAALGTEIVKFRLESIARCTSCTRVAGDTPREAPLNEKARAESADH